MLVSLRLQFSFLFGIFLLSAFNFSLLLESRLCRCCCSLNMQKVIAMFYISNIDIKHSFFIIVCFHLQFQINCLKSSPILNFIDIYLFLILELGERRRYSYSINFINFVVHILYLKGIVLFIITKGANYVNILPHEFKKAAGSSGI